MWVLGDEKEEKAVMYGSSKEKERPGYPDFQNLQ